MLISVITGDDVVDSPELRLIYLMIDVSTLKIIQLHLSKDTKKDFLFEYYHKPTNKY